MTTLPSSIPASAASSSSRHALVGALRSPLGIVASLLLVTLILLATFGPVIWGETAKIADLTQLSMAPVPPILSAPTPEDATCSRGC